MVQTLIPYVACEYFEPDARRFVLGLHGLKRSHGLRIRFIRDICFEQTDEGQRITFDHISGVFILHGHHLHRAVAERMEHIRDLYVFDSARHLPARNDTPIIRHFEVQDYSPGRPRFAIPRHVLYSGAD